MTNKMVDDEQIYRDMCGPVTPEDLKKVIRVTEAWAVALDNLKEASEVRIVFMACTNAISAMGPAYCRIAAATLLQEAKDIEQDRSDASEGTRS